MVMKLSSHLLRVVLCALALVIFTIPAAAQDFRGAIAGTITDSTGGVLPGVTVTVTNVETNGKTVITTDAKGFYEVRHLNAGSYSIEAQLEGFKSVLRKAVEVHVGD